MCGRSGTLFGTFVDACKHAKLPVCEVVQINVQGNFSNGCVQRHHVRPELPEGVDEENRIVPSVLASTITCTSSFCVNILSDSRGYSWVLYGSTVWDEGHGEVWVVMSSNDGSSWDFFLHLYFVSTTRRLDMPTVPRPRRKQPGDFLSGRPSFSQDIA